MSHHVSSAHTQQVFIHINSPELAPLLRSQVSPATYSGFPRTHSYSFLSGTEKGWTFRLLTASAPCLHARPELLL